MSPDKSKTRLDSSAARQVRVYEAASIRGQTTREAIANARTWLVSKSAVGEAAAGSAMHTSESRENERQP